MEIHFLNHSLYCTHAASMRVVYNPSMRDACYLSGMCVIQMRDACYSCEIMCHARCVLYKSGMCGIYAGRVLSMRKVCYTMRDICATSAGLRHKLSKLQLRAPEYPKGPPCIQRGPKKKKKKKRNQRKRKKERKSSKVRAENRSNYPPPSNLREFTNFIDYPPPSKSGRKIAPTTPPPRIYELHRLPFLEIGPENRSNYPPRIFSFCPFLLFSSLGPHTGLIRPCVLPIRVEWNRAKNFFS